MAYIQISNKQLIAILNEELAEATDQYLLGELLKLTTIELSLWEYLDNPTLLIKLKKVISKFDNNEEN